MKKLFFYALFAVMICSVCSCSKDDLVPEVSFPAESVDYFKNSLDFEYFSGEKTITFYSNVPWKITVDETRSGSQWCSVAPTSGEAGTATVKISVEENTTYDDRISVIRLAYGDSIRNILVNQKQLDALTVTSNRFEIPASGGNIDVDVKSNIDFNVFIADEYKDWIHQKTSNVSRGINLTNLTFTIDPSMEYDKREGNIEIISGEKKEVINVYQAGDGILTLTKKEFNITSEEQYLTIEVSSNFEYFVDMPQVDWISEIKTDSRAMSTHTINLLIKENESYDNRSAILKIYDKNSDLSEEVVINQSQINLIQINQKEFIFDENEVKFTVDINSNVEYAVEIKDTWVKEEFNIDTRGLTSKIHTFIVSEMKDGIERNAKIVFSDVVTGISDEIVVKQINSFYIDKYEVEMLTNESLYLVLNNNTGKDVKWESSDNSIVTVDQYGKINAVASGIASVKVFTIDGKHERVCKVIVNDISDYITVYCGGGSIISNNGLILYGSSLNWFFKNGSTCTVKLLSLQLIDGQTGNAGNEMSINADVLSGESVGYSVRVGLLGIHSPVTCRYKYECNGKTYSIDAVYKLN